MAREPGTALSPENRKGFQPRAGTLRLRQAAGTSLGPVSSKQLELRFRGKLTGFLGCGTFAGQTVSVQPTLRNQSEHVGYKGIMPSSA